MLAYAPVSRSLGRLGIAAALAGALGAWGPASAATAAGQEAAYCAVVTHGTTVEMVRPQPTDQPSVIDDVNWFARPVPNPQGHWIVGYASHNLNYLYDLTTGARIRIPDASDAVATPDGRYMTVPSHYTASGTVNFYDLPTLLDRLADGRDASDVPPVFAHAHPDVADVYYQSVGVVSERRDGATEVIVYRMMFSGGNHPEPPGFRIVDYELRRGPEGVVVTPGTPVRLCPEIVDDLATPFISKDGRYVVAHDDSLADRPASLKIFEILEVDPAARAARCAMRVDFGFAAGKADFSFDGSQLTFHISKHAYLTPFVNGGLRAPTITDVVVVDLERTDTGDIVGFGGLTRVTTSRTEGVGSYFPAFMPDGRVFYISNTAPRDAQGPKRYEFRVVDPAAERRTTNLFAYPSLRRDAAAIGELWRSSCAPEIAPFKPQEAEWAFLSLTPDRCRQLVESRWTRSATTSATRAELLHACARQLPTDDAP